MSRFLFYLGHPAHYHNFKNSIRILSDRGHEVKVVARGKDVLFELLEPEEWDVIKFPARTSGGRLMMIAAIARREWQMLRLAVGFKPHLMIGTDLVITHVGKLLGIKSVVVNEDDSAAVPLMAKYAFPYATALLAPHCCDQSPANAKKIGYEGYHELAYLHPELFQPNLASLPAGFEGKYFILRFASLHAHHDAGRKGISDDLALKLIAILKPFGNVFITSERSFSPALEPYRIKVDPSEMHQVMAHAQLYIGDSQTMAAEAAVLGIPSIRFNDFVGELSYLEELEHKYQLTVGIRSSEPDKLLALVLTWASDESLLERWKEQRSRMLKSTIAVTPFWVEEFTRLAGSNR